MTPFDEALAFILAEEGGRVDNPKDPGGRTDHGVTQRTFDAWQVAHKQPKRDVWTITEAEVTAIYRNAYFAPVRFDELHPGVGLCVADDAVNSGTHESIVELQRAVGVPADGALGDLTMAAVAKADPAVLIGRLCDGRLTFMRRLKAWVTFGKGWSNRVAAVRARALAMAAVSTPTLISAPTIVAPKIDVPVSEAVIPASPPCTRPGCPLRKAA